jgi:hypothetical protein
LTGKLFLPDSLLSLEEDITPEELYAEGQMPV